MKHKRIGKNQVVTQDLNFRKQKRNPRMKIISFVWLVKKVFQWYKQQLKINRCYVNDYEYHSLASLHIVDWILQKFSSTKDIQ